MKKGVSKIENQAEIWNKIIRNCQITDFCEKLGQLLGQLSLKLNGLETDRFLSAEGKCHRNRVEPNNEDPLGLENVKIKGQLR